ncbi:MAG: phosphatidate cytidylyltransferase [Bacteroidales bacterium]|nr:phosphatidate cytidylyltransferase [Bacteroidales bacterium]
MVRVRGACIGLSRFALSLYGHVSASTVFVAILLLLVIGMVDLVLVDARSNFVSLATTLFGNLYVTLPFVLMHFLGSIGGPFKSTNIILNIFALIWLSDTAAYVFGVMFGKHKIVPAISPNKSWEGFIASVLSTIAAVLSVSWFFPQLGAGAKIILAISIALASFVGDLAESKLKRLSGAKRLGKNSPRPRGNSGSIGFFSAGCPCCLYNSYFYGEFVI